METAVLQIVFFDFLSGQRLAILVPVAAACDAVEVDDALGKKVTYIFSCQNRRSPFHSQAITQYMAVYI